MTLSNSKKPPMRAAVCFYGVLNRSLRFTLAGIKAHVLEPLQAAGFDVSVFAHGLCVDADAYSNPRAHEAPQAAWDMSNDEAVVALGCTDVLLERQVEVDARIPHEPYLTHGDPWTADHEHTEADVHATFCNHLRALYSINNVTQLWCTHAARVARRATIECLSPEEKPATAEDAQSSGFDLVVYVRPDVIVCAPLKPRLLRSVALLGKRGVSMVCASKFQQWSGCNDTFAIATPLGAFALGTRWRHALEYSQAHPLHSERFLLASLKDAGVGIKLLALRVIRIRRGGHIALCDLWQGQCVPKRKSFKGFQLIV